MPDTIRHLAAIDIGTNSFHLILVAFDPKTGRFKILDRDKEIVRLGSGSSDMKYMTKSAMNRGILALRRFKMIADSIKAPIRAVATSAVREALNKEEFIRLARTEADVKIEIVSGFEEARLIYFGVLQALPVINNEILLIDVGGGSTEFLIGKQRNIFYDNSLKMGAVRLTQLFFDAKPTVKSIKKCREYIQGMMIPVTRALHEFDYDVTLGTSGTILNIANMVRCMHGEKPDSKLNNFTFQTRDFFPLAERIIKAKISNSQIRINGLDPERSDIILAGVLIYEQIFEQLNIREITVSDYALREGIIFDTIEKRRRIKRDAEHRDIRYESVLHIAENFRYEPGHSHHVAQLALRIFDQTKELHHLGNMERLYLEAASILHEVGLFVSHAQHHRHSHYLIRNSELLGYTENEKEIIANIARYHRKSHPKDKHEDFQHLTSDEKEIVKKLAAILRIADGLDRTHSNAIIDITCKKRSDVLTLLLKRARVSNIELELWGANRKKQLFEETYNTRIRFKLG